ncbi:MAG: hypothetical protein RLZZ26_555 [Candidatus Parcubacteria bacterium]|jgi:putative membrane protein
MPPTSALQSQYPLSSRKFKKKILAALIPQALLSIFCALPIALSSFYVTGNNDSHLFIPFWIGAACIFLTVTVAVYAAYMKAYIKRYFYDANDNYITIKKGVFAPAEIHVQYSKIQDVYVDQDIIDRIMGLYDVHLASATAASGMQAHIDGVEQAAAEGLKNFLLQKLQGGGTSTPASVVSVPAPAVESVVLGKEVSSATYPIVGTWYAQQMIVWIFTSLLYTLVSFRLLVLFNPTPSFSYVLYSGLIVFVVIYALHIGYMVLWRSSYFFNFLPDYIVIRQGVIAKNETHLPYRSVQDVTVSQGVIERLLNIATVRIENAAAMATGNQTSARAVVIPGQPLAQANEISDAIKRVALTKSSSQTGL